VWVFFEKKKKIISGVPLKFEALAPELFFARSASFFLSDDKAEKVIVNAFATCLHSSIREKKSNKKFRR
jgi:hypothetical protein